MPVLQSTKLHFKNIGFERHFRWLFNELNCELTAGDVLQIRGPNGSGKSTLLRILAGLIEPHQGNVTWDTDTRIHYLGHYNGIKPYLTVYENLEMSYTLTKQIANPKRIVAVIKQMDLENVTYTAGWYLSAGQCRRLALARLILHPAPIWILDEPTTSLDKEGQQLFLELLDEHVKQNGIAILTTHHDVSFQKDSKVIHLGKYDA